MTSRRFLLKFAKENLASAYVQYNNLIKWFNERNMKYQFLYHDHGGHYLPHSVVLSEDDAVCFKLFFKTVPEEDTT